MFRAIYRTLAKSMVRPLYGSSGGLVYRVSPGSEVDADLDTVYTSRVFYPPADVGDAVTITGGTYQENEAGGFVSSATTYADGDSFELRGTSSGSYSTASSVVLTVGGVDYTYTMTTEVDPATLNTVTFGGESVTFDGDTTVTLGA